MRIFRACDLGGRSKWIWEEDARIWWSCEWIDRHDGVILHRREYHAEVAMISASQGGWDGTRVGFEFIFEMVECFICRLPAGFVWDRVLEVGVFVFDGGGQRHDSSLSSVTRGVHKGNKKLSLVEL